MTSVGISRHRGGERLVRHRHSDGYAALVLSGGYLEAGDHGRFQLKAGHVVLHGAYEAHSNEFSTLGATVLNLPITGAYESETAIAQDADAVARLAERDLFGAAELLRTTSQGTKAARDDWPDKLATALANGSHFSLAEWADQMGLAPQSLSRGFRRAYGVSPKRYRAELRALRAVRVISGSHESLAALAVGTGFADQAHLSRAVIALTGTSPKRIKVQSVQEGTHPTR